MLSKACVSIESTKMKKLSSIIGLNKYIPQYYGETYFGDV